MEIKNLDKSYDGKIISCYIHNEFIEEGKIIYDQGVFYIFQNKVDGAVPRSRISRNSYVYSWCVDGGDEIDLKGNGVKDIKLLSNVNNSYEIY